MPAFQIEALDAKGKKVLVDVDATTRDEAIAAARKQGLRPTKIAAKPAGGKPAKAPPAAGGEQPKKKGFVFGGVSQKEMTQFTTQLSILLNAGLPIVRSLEVLSAQMKTSVLKNIVDDVSDDVKGGSTLSDALGKHPKAFDRLYVNMVKAGEAGGVLDTILERLAVFQEKSLRLKKRVIGAMIYPLVVITVTVVILTVIMTVVVPKFEALFADQGAEMPLITQMLLTASRTIAAWWFVIPLIPVLLYMGYTAISRTVSGRLAIDRLILSAPLFGVIIKKSVIARFTRTLGTLISSGVPILEALFIIKETVGNKVISGAVEDVHASIKEGESIAGPLRQSHVFDAMIVNMIEVGEETGELDKMLIKIADTYDEDVDVAVEAMTSVMEPILIVGLGGAVAFIVLALFSPMIKLLETAGGGAAGK